MALIGRQLTNGNYLKLDNISSQFNNTQKTFNLTTAGQPFYPGSVFSVLISVGDVIQEPATSYTIDQATITFASAPTTGSAFFGIVLGISLGVGVPADGTVTGTKLSSPFNYNSGLLYLDTTNNRVGILSTSPTVALDVVGNSRVSGITNLNGLSVSGISTLGTVQISSGIVTASSGIVTYYGDGSKLSNIISGVSISTNTTNQSQYLTYVTGTGSTTGFGITTTGLVFNPSSGNLGIGTTNATSKLQVSGNVSVSGVVTATTFVGALTGTATSTTNIPNLTGAITSNNTTTSLGSFTSAQLATALTDETGSGANVFATSPVLVTPSLGIATATSINASGIITATQLSTGASGTGVNITTDTISGPATLTIDPAGVGDNTGAVRIKGDLYVDGTQFIVNSTTIELADFNVGIATTVGTNALLDGAGIGIGSTSIRKTLTWSNSSTALKSSEDFDVASGKVYKIAGTSVLSNNTLGSGVVTSSLTSVGTLEQLNVTGVSTFTNGPVFIGAATSTGTTSQPLQVTGGAYVSGSVGIGTKNPLGTLQVGSGTSTFIVTGIGSVGIGITNPQTALHLGGGGNIRLNRSDNARSSLIFHDNNGFNINANTSGDDVIINAGNTSGRILLQNNSSTTLIAQSGTVLVGTATSTGTASQPLQVTGGAYVSGSVGIGTTNPGATLNVVPTATSIAGLFSGTTSSDMVRITQLGTGNALVVEDSANPDSSPFVVTGIGSVGIGTASPAFTADIAGDARVTSTNKMRFGGTAGTTNFYIQYNSTANSLDFVAG